MRQTPTLLNEAMHLRRGYKALSDSGVTATTRDEITGWGVEGGVDKIDLSVIDGDTVHSGAQHFHFIGLDNWDHTPGALRYVYTATQTIVEADVNGDAKADFSIALDGHLNLAGTDFIL